MGYIHGKRIGTAHKRVYGNVAPEPPWPGLDQDGKPIAATAAAAATATATATVTTTKTALKDPPLTVVAAQGGGITEGAPHVAAQGDAATNHTTATIPLDDDPTVHEDDYIDILAAPPTSHRFRSSRSRKRKKKTSELWKEWNTPELGGVTTTNSSSGAGSGADSGAATSTSTILLHPPQGFPPDLVQAPLEKRQKLDEPAFADTKPAAAQRPSQDESLVTPKPRETPSPARVSPPEEGSTHLGPGLGLDIVASGLGTGTGTKANTQTLLSQVIDPRNLQEALLQLPRILQKVTQMETLLGTGVSCGVWKGDPAAVSSLTGTTASGASTTAVAAAATTTSQVPATNKSYSVQKRQEAMLSRMEAFAKHQTTAHAEQVEGLQRRMLLLEQASQTHQSALQAERAEVRSLEASQQEYQEDTTQHVRILEAKLVSREADLQQQQDARVQERRANRKRISEALQTIEQLRTENDALRQTNSAKMQGLQNENERIRKMLRTTVWDPTTPVTGGSNGFAELSATSTITANDEPRRKLKQQRASSLDSPRRTLTSNAAPTKRTTVINSRVATAKTKMTTPLKRSAASSDQGSIGSRSSDDSPFSLGSASTTKVVARVARSSRIIPGSTIASSKAAGAGNHNHNHIKPVPQRSRPRFPSSSARTIQDVLPKFANYTIDSLARGGVPGSP